MTVNEQFKAALTAGKLSEALKIAMASAVELKITTEVIDAIAPKQSLTTRINLVEGSINNQLNQEFVTKSSHQALQKFHFEQVDQVNQTIQQNLNTLTKIFRLLATLQSSQIKPISPHTTPLITPQVELRQQQATPFTPVITPQVEENTNFINTTIKNTTPELAREPATDNTDNTLTPDLEVVTPEIVIDEPEFENFSLEDIKNEEDEQDWGDLLDDLDEEDSNKTNRPKNRDSDDEF